jgi:DNA polymerase
MIFSTFVEDRQSAPARFVLKPCRMTPERTKAARDLLAFYVEAGADALLGEAPVDRFADQEPAKIPAAPPPAKTSTRPPLSAYSQKTRTAGERPSQPAAPMTAPPSPDAAAADARQRARSAATLDELRRILESFEGCELKRHARQLVFCDGNPQARVMFVGEAPGREEDNEGLPFVGRSGKLLDLMMKAIGLDRTNSYIANIIPWRPPGNRTPTPQESQICLPFIQRQIELVDPDILVSLGGPSSQTLLGFTDGIMKTRGRWLTFNTGTRDIRAIATLHPAYLLRQPLHKRLAWRDFLAIKKGLSSPDGAKA